MYVQVHLFAVFFTPHLHVKLDQWQSEYELRIQRVEFHAFVVFDCSTNNIKTKMHILIFSSTQPHTNKKKTVSKIFKKKK